MAEVSIVIPTKNRPQLLNRAINSILKQTYEDWELFIINDAETKATINFSDSRIQIINNKNKTGANGARNTGINLATGNYIAFLDDDDAWHEDKLLKQVNLMDTTKAILCYTGKKIIYQKKNTSITRFSYRTHILSPQFTLQLHNYIGTTSSVIIRSDALYDGIVFDESLHSLQDYDFYLQLVEKGSFVGISEGLVTYYFDELIQHISARKITLFNSAWKIFLKQKGLLRLSILVGLLVIVLQKIYKNLFYKLA